MIESETKIKILEDTREISGREHRLVERDDGFRFYLDPIFLYTLEHADESDLAEKLQEMGARENEVPVIHDILRKAALLPHGNTI